MGMKDYFLAPLRYRFLLSMSLMLLPLLAVAWSAVSSLHAQRGLMTEIVQEILHEKEPIMRIQDRVQQAVILLTSQREDSREEDFGRFREIENEIDATFAMAGALPLTKEIERSSIETARLQWGNMKETAAALIALPPSEEKVRLRLFDRIYSAHEEIIGALRQLQENSDEAIAKAEDEISEVETRTVWTVLSTFAIGFGIVILVGTRLARSVLQPMRALSAGARQLTSGNLEHRIAVNRQDEFGILMKTFNEMAAALQDGQKTLRDLADRDPLTELYNHREFFRLLQDEVDRACRYDHPLSLLMIDLDKFKDINDLLGHLVGDRVLQHVGAVISRQIRKSDHASRYGGDEFAILLPETDLPEAFDFAERLRQAVATQPVNLENGVQLSISMSVGVAAFPEDAETYLQLVDVSDRALYAAKQNPTNKVCCKRGVVE